MKREDILDTASLLFAQRGFRGTNMKLLAQEAQASTSTIYSYFKDKTDLLRQSIEYRLETLEAGHLEKLAQLDDPVEALLQGISLLNAAVAGDPLLSRLVVYESQVTGVRVSNYARRVLKRIDDHNIALVKAAIDQGFLEFDEPDALVFTLRLALQGWLLDQARGNTEMSQEKLTLTVKRLLLGLMKDG